ncbi:MAG: succinylglutamate-semialdehyde dehydrogenase [Parachlamydiaceae bacterium]|nr:succinylglutamate-semialdehyde dehydrogenase [Parachlamydiaceae bacterium]
MSNNTDKPSLFIRGKWISGKGPLLISENPATGAAIWEGASADTSDVNLAVKAAHEALPAWSGAPAETRISYLKKFQALLEKNRKTIVETISLECGKPLWDADNEVSAMIGKLDISIEAFTIRCKQISKSEGTKKSILHHRPHGVIGVFGPFNFPAHLPNGHFLPALLAGNTIVFKPSDQTPLVAEKIFKLWEEVGLPPGVMNLLQGGIFTGQALSRHPDIDGIFFTGSWAVGKHLTELYSDKAGKILALEMGGNNPLIFTDVDDLKAAAYVTIQSAFLTSGQRCTCARRLIIPQGYKGDAFIKELITMTQNLKIGSYTDMPEPFMGPVISAKAATKLMDAQQKIMDQGAHSLLKMTQLEQGPSFLSPGIIDVTALAERKDEEHFGPLLQIIRVKDFDAALIEANNTNYGLTAGLLSRNKNEFEQFSKYVKAGILAWNSPTTNVSSSFPFGGTGKSGNFRPTAFYAADYCAYPVTYIENEILALPETPISGIITTHGAPNEVC